MNNKIFKYLFGIALVVAIILLGIILYTDVKSNKTTDNTYKVQIKGSYYSDETKEVMVIPNKNKFPNNISDEIIIKGNFTKDIPKNKQVIMKIDNLLVDIWINNVKVYSLNNESRYSKSGGNLWGTFISDGILKDDEVTIELTNVYPKLLESSFKEFLDNIYYGYESDIILKNIRSGLFKCFFSIFIISIGIITIIFKYIAKKTNIYIPSLTAFIILSICTGICFFIDFSTQYYFFPYPIVSNSIEKISELLGSSCLVFYFANYFKSKCKNTLIKISYIPIILSIIASVLQIFRIKDYYNLSFIILILNLLIVLSIIFAYIYELYMLKNKKIKNLIISIIVISIGVTGDGIVNYLGYKQGTLFIKLGFFIFTILEFMRFSKIVKGFFKERTKIEVLKEVAYKDSLTNVNNRASYSEKIEEINKKIKKNSRFGIIIFDINNLKMINDNLGHCEGDSIIINNSEYICEVFGRENVYRIGGDEFVVILEGKYYKKMDKLIKTFEDNVNGSYKSKNYYMKGSIFEVKNDFAYGISKYTSDFDNNFEDVFKRADYNMYINKKRMKNK